MPTAETVHLSVVDDGARAEAPTCPQIPHHRTVEEWAESERGRGLLLIEQLATSWSSRAVVDFPFCSGLGTAVWAEVTLTADTAPGTAPVTGIER